MKKFHFYGGLLVIHPLISTNSSSLTISVKNSKDHSPPIEHAKHTQAVISAVQTAPENKPNLKARFYAPEKRRRIPEWRLEDLALLKIIKTNALRLWNNHRPDRKIIGQENQSE
jgi:hypothetical protein